MYHHHHQSHNDTFSPRTKFPAEKHLLLQGGSISEGSGLVLSTDAKPRLKWTSELHERFTEAVNQLGGADKATPKSVMRIMGIPGLTLYHLKSHLQKYRLSKNLQTRSQAPSENTKSVMGYKLADERITENNASFIDNRNMIPQSNKPLQINETLQMPNFRPLQINETLQMQIEVQRQLQEQLEVQRHLQLQIEAQGKYLQSVLEKAQETLGKPDLGSPGVGVDKIQFSELVSKGPNECSGLSFPGLESIPGSNTLNMHPAQLAAHSLESCQTLSEGSEKDSVSKSYGTYSSNINHCRQKIHENTRLENIQPRRCYLDEHNTFSLSFLGNSERTTFSAQNFEIIPISTKNQREGRGGSDEDMFLENPTINIPADHRFTGNRLNNFELPCHISQLDLNADEGNGGTTNGNFDLNGFS